MDGGGVGDVGHDSGGSGGGETGVSSVKAESGVSDGKGAVESGVSEGKASESSISKGKAEGSGGSYNITLLPFGGDGGVSGGVFSLSGGYLGGVDGGDGKGKVEDGGDEGSGGKSGGSDGKVGTSHTESVDGIGDVVDSLEETVSVKVLVGAGGHAIGVTGLTTGRWTSSVSKGELTELILSVELVRRSGYWSIDPGMSGKKLGASSGHTGCQYDQSVHVDSS